MRIQIDNTQIEGLAALWARFPEIAGEEMHTAVVQGDQLILGALQQALPQGAGAIRGGAGLVGSLFTEEERLRDNVIGMVASPLPYAEYVEIGTRPHFPPLAPLEEWVSAKLGIDDDKERRSVAFLIARKISRKGTKPDGSWQRVADAVQPRVARTLEDGVERIIDRALGGAGGLS